LRAQIPLDPVPADLGFAVLDYRNLQAVAVEDESFSRSDKDGVLRGIFSSNEQ
jgi:hypothetical protein